AADAPLAPPVAEAPAAASRSARPTAPRGRALALLLPLLLLAAGCQTLESLSPSSLASMTSLGGDKIGSDAALEADLEALDRLTNLPMAHFRDTARVTESRGGGVDISTEPGFQ